MRARVARQDIGREQHHLPVRVDDLAILGDHAQTVAVAVKGDADFGVALLQAADQVLQIFGLCGIRMVIGEGAVHLAEQLNHVQTEPAKQVAGDSAGHAVAAIDGDLHRARHRHVADDARQVGGADVVAAVGARRGRWRCVMGHDVVVQIGNGSAVDRFAGQHHLEAVVVGRIVAARDHDAAGGVEHVGGIVEHGRGHHAQVDHVHTGALQAGGQRRGQFRSGQAPVAPDDHRLLAPGQRGAAKGLADLPCDTGVQGHADNAADIIGLENGLGQSKHGETSEVRRARGNEE